MANGRVPRELSGPVQRPVDNSRRVGPTRREATGCGARGVERSGRERRGVVWHHAILPTHNGARIDHGFTQKRGRAVIGAEAPQRALVGRRFGRDGT